MKDNIFCLFRPSASANIKYRGEFTREPIWLHVETRCRPLKRLQNNYCLCVQMLWPQPFCSLFFFSFVAHLMPSSTEPTTSSGLSSRARKHIHTFTPRSPAGEGRRTNRRWPVGTHVSGIPARSPCLRKAGFVFSSKHKSSVRINTVNFVFIHTSRFKSSASRIENEQKI